MTRRWCGRESDVVQALRGGASTPELREHVLGCAICSETQAVARRMTQTASVVGRGLEPPAASVVWRRAEERRKEVALKQAMRPLMVMRVLGAVFGLLSAGWVLHLLPFLPFVTFMELLSGWGVLRDEATCFAAAIAVLSIAIGAGYLLHDSRRSGERVPST
jgi:predicted nucleic acid-binding Zn ribbon protein